MNAIDSFGHWILVYVHKIWMMLLLKKSKNVLMMLQTVHLFIRKFSIINNKIYHYHLLLIPKKKKKKKGKSIRHTITFFYLLIFSFLLDFIISDFAIVLMDPVISNFLSACIMRWLRNNVHDDAPENLEQLINYSSKLLNLAEHASFAARTEKKIPRVDKDLKEYWKSFCKLVLLENKSKATIKPADAERQSIMLAKSDIARKVFVEYVIDRTVEGDIASLQRLLPFIVETLPNPGSTTNDNNNNAAYEYTYESFIYTFINILMKKWLVECVMDDKWKSTIFNNFLIHVAHWNARVHKQVVSFLMKYFVGGVKHQRLLGEKIGLLAEWADRLCQQGNKDEKVNTMKQS